MVLKVKKRFPINCVGAGGGGVGGGGVGAGDVGGNGAGASDEGGGSNGDGGGDNNDDGNVSAVACTCRAAGGDAPNGNVAIEKLHEGQYDVVLSDLKMGGSDGMDFVRALLAGVRRHMSDEAVLVLEVGHERAHFEAAFRRLPAVWLPTSAGDDQVLLLAAEHLS